jgi:hypothetical protein
VTAAEALAFVERHGVVLESAHHAEVPSLAEAVAGERIRGHWWSHAKGSVIFAATRAVRDSPDVLVCRLVEGKVTFAHARLWPALVRLGEWFPRERLARIREVHTERGVHRAEAIPFPEWVLPGTSAAAAQLDESAARASLGALVETLAMER